MFLEEIPWLDLKHCSGVIRSLSRASKTNDAQYRTDTSLTLLTH